MIFLECAGPIWWRDGGLGLLHIAGNKGAYGLLNIECRISDREMRGRVTLEGNIFPISPGGGHKARPYKEIGSLYG